MADVNTHLQRRLLAEINRHYDHHETARTVVNVTVLVSLRSLGPALTVEFLRDAADFLEREAIVEVLQ